MIPKKLLLSALPLFLSGCWRRESAPKDRVIQTFGHTTRITNPHAPCATLAKESKFEDAQKEMLQMCKDAQASDCHILPVTFDDLPGRCHIDVVVEGYAPSQPPPPTNPACVERRKSLLRELGLEYRNFLKDVQNKADEYFACTGEANAFNQDDAAALAFFYHEAHHTLGGGTKDGKRFAYYVRPGSPTVTLPYFEEVVRNRDMRREIGRYEFLDDLLGTYFTSDGGNNFYSNLDEWNAYLADASLSMAMIKSCRGRDESPMAHRPSEWILAMALYLESQEKHAKTYERLRGVPEIKIFVRDLLERSLTQAQAVRKLPCVARRVAELDAKLPWAEKKIREFVR